MEGCVESWCVGGGQAKGGWGIALQGGGGGTESSHRLTHAFHPSPPPTHLAPAAHRSLVMRDRLSTVAPPHMSTLGRHREKVNRARANPASAPQVAGPHAACCHAPRSRTKAWGEGWRWGRAGCAIWCGNGNMVRQYGGQGWNLSGFLGWGFAGCWPPGDWRCEKS